MTENVVFKLDKDIFRENLSKYTRKAFQMLPTLDEPRILDIGCGSGVPTMELARLCNGQIIGVDTNQSLLDELTKKIREAGLSDRVHTLRCSLVELDFPDESFDILWSEGSIFAIGFAKGIKEWRRFIAPKGFLVVHDEAKDTSRKCEQISDCGYDLMGHFTLPGDTWWKEYYAPLEKHINEIRTECSDPRVLSVCDNEQEEIERFKMNPSQYGSVFFVMQKR